MKFKDLIDFENYAVKKEYQFEENESILDLSKVSEIIDIDDIIYNISFIDHEYWVITIGAEIGFSFEIELRNYDSHPEITYLMIKYLKNEYKKFINLYHELPNEYKLKLELDD